jgi:hypothetical protein
VKKLWVSVLGLAVLGFGCAEVMKVAPAFVGKFLTISIEPVVGFPAEATLEGFENSEAGKTAGLAAVLFTAATGESLQKKVGGIIAKNAEPYTVALTDAFKKEIRRRDLYKGIVDQGGNVSLRLSVARYGLSAAGGLDAMKPLLDVKSDVILPGWGVVWTRSYKVDPKSMQTAALSATKLLTGAASFQKAFNSASDEAAIALLAELK